jgi:dipeptidyl aminopeptidase/acylaminoacyl peptidase
MTEIKLSNTAAIFITTVIFAGFLVADLTAANAQTKPATKQKDKKYDLSKVFEDGTIKPEVEIQKEDYAIARRKFKTKFIKEGPSPQKVKMPEPPAGVTAIEFPSGNLTLKAWINTPPIETTEKYPAVLFLHGGFNFGKEDWDMTEPFRAAGFIVLAPILRGEDGQAGNFSLFYDEVEDVMAANDYLRKQSFVDTSRIYVAGHSAGGTMALLAAMTSRQFRAAASFSASPDQILFVKYGFPKQQVPFDQTDPREFQLRSPLAYAASFKCPVRIYYGTAEPHWRISSELTAKLARKKKLNVETIRIEGSHDSAVADEMKQSIDFFKEYK